MAGAYCAPGASKKDKYGAAFKKLQGKKSATPSIGGALMLGLKGK